MSSKQVPEGELPLVPHHWGSTIKFNLKLLRRKKKQDRQITAEMFTEGCSDERHPLYLYLKTEDGHHPWIVAYHGHREVLKSPIIMKAFTNKWKPCIAQTIFVNTANRKNHDPITRHYELEFNTEVEAQSFVCTLNLMCGADESGREGDDNVDDSKNGKGKDTKEGSSKSNVESNDESDHSESNDKGENREDDSNVDSQSSGNGDENSYISDDEESVYPDVFPPDEYFMNTQDPFSGYISD